MKKLNILFLFCLFVVLSLPLSTLHAQETTTFILVRHAEKVDDGTKDPALSEAGKRRAQKLADHLKETQITAIYSMPYKRTQNTVQKIAEQKKLKIKEYAPFGPNTLDKILAQEKGGIILISGHSNTTPFFVNKLIGEERYSQLDEFDYDNLFIVTITGKGKGQVVHLTY